MTAEPGPRPAAMPSLDALADAPQLADGLPREALGTLYHRAAILEAHLRALVLAGSPAESPAPEGDRVLFIAEAASRLGMKPDTLYRKWRALGLGYRDADGHVKFSARALERYVARKAARPS